MGTWIDGDRPGNRRIKTDVEARVETKWNDKTEDLKCQTDGVRAFQCRQEACAHSRRHLVSRKSNDWNALELQGCRCESSIRGGENGKQYFVTC